MSDFSTDQAAQRKRRERAIRTTVITSAVTRVLSALCSLAQVPLALTLLGNEAFGFWATLTSIILLLNAADFGLGPAMQNQVAEAVGRNLIRRTAALFLTAFLGLTMIGAILWGLGALVIRLVDWSLLFQLTQPELAAGAGHGVLAALVLFSLGLPLTSATRLASACQWGGLAALWNLAGVTGQLLVIIWAGRVDLSFTGFVLLVGTPPLLASLGLLVNVARRLGWRRADLRLATREEQQNLLHGSWSFCLPQISAAFIFNAAAPVISAVAGAPAVTTYSVVQRLFGLFGQLHQMVLGPLWPAYTEAATREDSEWILTSYRRSLRGTLIGICFPLVVAAAALPWVIERWTGRGTVDLPGGLVWLLCAWNVLLAMSNAPAYLLGGLGSMRRLGWISFVGSVFSVAGMLLLGLSWGANGVIAALVATQLTIILPASLYEASITLRSVQRKQAASARSLLPDTIRQQVIRLLSGPPRGPRDRHFSAGIFKVDRLGDFVLALGAIRRLTTHFGPENCLLIISTVAEPLAALEFPHTPRLVLPVAAGGILRDLVPTARRHRHRFANVHCEAAICLRHQRETYHEVAFSWLPADRRITLNPQEYPDSRAGAGHQVSAEIAAHRRVVASALDRDIRLEEVIPAFASFQKATGSGVLVCPFSIDPTRDIPATTLLAALREWSQPEAIQLSGAPADQARLEALCTEARKLGITNVSLAEPADSIGFIHQVAAAKIVLTADSAGAHIATAFDKPAVVLQGGAFAGVFGPWQRSSRQIWLQHPLPCFGCGSHCTESENFCLTRISSRQIVDALQEVSR